MKNCGKHNVSETTKLYQAKITAHHLPINKIKGKDKKITLFDLVKFAKAANCHLKITFEPILKFEVQDVKAIKKTKK